MNLVWYSPIVQKYCWNSENFLKAAYLPFLEQEIEEQNFHPITPTSLRGFRSDVTVSNKKGIYLIYKKTNQSVLLYVGCATSCIYGRITRFIAQVNGTIREDENHPAAKKYVNIFGNDLNDLYFKYILIEDSNLLEGTFHHTVFDLENLLIKKYEPLFNTETFYKYAFVKQDVPKEIIKIGNVEIHKR